MVRMTIGVGAGLVLLGIVGFVGSGAESITALIPAAFGAVLAGLGWGARHTDRRKLLVHLALTLAVIGVLGSAMGLAELPALLAGDPVDRPWAVAVQSIMAVVLALYIALGVRSFVTARRAPTAG